MLKKLLVSLLAVFLLAGCGSNSTNSNVTDDNDFSGQTLNIYLPGEYIDEEVVAEFEQEYDVKVNISLFASNEEMYTKLLGGTSYDILIPSDYMIEKLISEKMIKEIDKTKIPSIKDLYDGMLCDYDPDNKYSVPYFWGSVGIVYDTRKIDQKDVESQGWDVLKNPKYKDLTYMYDSERDSFMVALKALGYSMNTHDEKELEDAYNWLIDLDNKVLPMYVTDEIIDGLATISDDKYMGVVYSGDATYILSENENAKFFCPEEGTNIWTDAMVLHKDCKNDDLAYAFIDWMISYDNALANSEYTGYTSPNAKAMEDLSNGEFADYNSYVPRSGFAKDEVYHHDDEVKKIISEYWIHVKSNRND